MLGRLMKRLQSKWGQYCISRQRDFCDVSHDKLGTAYGGWYIPSNLLHSASICYSAGAGEDISFDIELSRRYDCNVYIIDPTPRALRHYETLKDNFPNHLNNPNQSNNSASINATFTRLQFLAYGLWSERKTMRFYAPQDPTHVSHSLVNAQQTADYFDAECRTIMDFMSEFKHTEIALLKLDVEGAEYDIINSLLTNSIHPSILCLEFDEGHNPQDANYLHRILSVISRLKEAGYLATFFDSWNVTFVRKEALAKSF